MINKLYLRAKLFILALFLKEVERINSYVRFEEPGEYYWDYNRFKQKLVYFSYAEMGLESVVVYYNTYKEPEYILISYFNTMKKYKELTNEP